MSEPPNYRQPTDPYRENDPTQVYPRQQAPGPYPGPSSTPQQAPRPEYRPETPSEQRRRALDPAALWSGGVVTAVVAALVALAGLIVIRGILKIAVLSPSRTGTVGDSSTVFLVVAAFGFGLLATAILHALLLTTPQPITFFGWLVALVTIIVALLPLTTSAQLDTKVATALLYVVIGLVGGLLLSGAGARARKQAAIPPSAPPRR